MATADEIEPLIKNNTLKKRNSKLITIATSVIIFSLVFVAFLLPYISRDKPVEPRLVVGAKGAVAVELEECSNAGIDILKKGGNAVDSAIASALCIGVVDSFASGIGGGGYMLIRSPNGSYEFIDFRETAPAGSHKYMFEKDPSEARKGGLAVAVPGEIRGFELAHQRHGVLNWEELFSSAIHVAEDGFMLTDLLHSKLKSSKKWIEKRVGFSDVYAPSGVIAEVGDIIKRPTLGKTLRRISKEGANAFYEGIIAQNMVNTTQAEGGILTMDDLKNYKPVIRTIIESTYHDKRVITCSSPTSGPIILNILNVLEGYNLKTEGPTAFNIHRITEAMKFGFAFRTELVDPGFLDNEERMMEIISKEWADIVRKNITDGRTHGPLYYSPKYENNNPHGTMHLSVVDKDDGAVSLTSTVNLKFGSRIMDPATGIIMNDEMDDFSIPGVPNSFGLYPSIYNYPAPGKRPLSTITPVIIEDDKNNLELVVGGSGGSQILTATLNVILNTYDFGFDLFKAVNEPRFHHQLFPNGFGYEEGYSKEILSALEDIGHKTYDLATTGTVSASQAIMRFKNGILHAVSDPRKQGLAAAY